ncbi:uncharacterized protein BP01DRAFT_357949 [Aspergillus saccharolyticus JOP 1030-1]|uniref:Uncharacterized protein n=1 Tax=Aspergillus saccharolyticus JOP 1030-1 TaxID=1450539 RepID=A0A318ZAL3_9EURO|nr:hypothetical protein BP01DRAFT_357949 [Aspergillus saccharolyticus JOP 1030-1]PYH44329.1 hypothetical protein BP01DRAFT_357949 [Aspergillus saccharolyticus JOP 1030-1]
MLLLHLLLLLHRVSAAAGSASLLPPKRDIRSQDTTSSLDEPLLAVQIGGIIAAYLFTVIFLLSLLLVVGRRLRRAVLSSNYSLQVQMLQPMKPPPSMDPSPVTPISIHLPSPGGGDGGIPATVDSLPVAARTNRTWSRNRSTSTFSKHSSSSHHHHHHQHQHQKSNPSSNISLATFDEGVVASDRRKAQEDLEMLYAAVLEHDEMKAGGGGTQTGLGISPTDTLNSSNPFKDPPAPAQLPTSPRTPSRLSRISSSLSLFAKGERDRSEGSAGASRGGGGGGGSGGGGGLRSPRLALPLRKKMSISSPITSPRGRGPVGEYEGQGEGMGDPYAHEPLTPRVYHPAPPPPVPPVVPSVVPLVQQQQQQQQQQQPYTYQPTEGTTEEMRTQRERALPTPRGIFTPPTTTTTPGTERDRERERRIPPPLSLTHPAATTTSAGGAGGRSLPLRDAYPLQSAPATKLTVLERPVKHPGGAGPRTGIPTPYSPYMPFTPVTPLTPSRMVTKRQRRREGRENGLHVLNEDDLVRGGGDLWGY